MADTLFFILQGCTVEDLRRSFPIAGCSILPAGTVQLKNCGSLIKILKDHTGENQKAQISLRILWLKTGIHQYSLLPGPTISEYLILKAWKHFRLHSYRGFQAGYSSLRTNTTGLQNHRTRLSGRGSFLGGWRRISSRKVKGKRLK
jgi:hypothetical protein